jgi:ATP-dependent protease ClpP protease subunit
VTRTDFDRHRWFTAPEAVAYGLADEVIGSPAEAPESGTPA